MADLGPAKAIFELERRRRHDQIDDSITDVGRHHSNRNNSNRAAGLE
jgi:hypothetical protein